MKNPDHSLCFRPSETYAPFPLGPEPRPKAPSERNVFRLLGTKFAVQLSMKPPLRGQGSVPPRGDEDPGPGGGASCKEKLDSEFRT